MLVCLVHLYSEVRDLVSCPLLLSESCMFICYFPFSLYSDPFQYDPKKCEWRKLLSESAQIVTMLACCDCVLAGR